ncbi:chromatin assembly factor 1 subunit A [Amyelois transitella]|uniref:chromatin assembly factor 1 subunit A n=1 Tax=Amyelois transitella TaxID=680683 RepID=UPI00298FD701|nr:chromatin assembly factor 1 subunit A [Amyelois transitella]
MKTSKSPVNKEVTPSKKKLTQARLPFKLISDASPTTVPQQPRKRKLSAPNSEPLTKIGKISKENGLTDDTVVISNDECKIEKEPQNDDKTMNPFVKLVDTAWKKKQKSKNKKNEKKKKDPEILPTSIKSSECEEAMEVEPSDCVSDENGIPNHDQPPKIQPSSPSESDVDKSSNAPVLTEKSADFSNNVDLIVLDRSNNSNDVNLKTNNETPADIGTEKNCEPHNKNTSDLQENGENKNDVISKEKCTDLEKSEESQKPKDKSKINVLTPKRSSRNKAKQEENSHLNSSTLNDSICSTPSTPKMNRSSSVSNSIGNESLNDSSASLTPKQQQKKLEYAKKKEEREKEKQEREKKKQQEKEERAKLKQEKEEQKKREREEKEEAKKREKEEKEEQKRKEREEKERQKELEKKLKEEKEDQKRKEREEKEEQRKKEKEAREEEKRKKQEAIELEKQEQELKKKKAAEAFTNFFVPKQKSEKYQTTEPASKTDILSSFRVKVDMRLAPTVRNDLTEEKRDNLDKLMERQNKEKLYLKSLKEGIAKPLSSGKTWPLDDKDNDVMIIEDELPPMDPAGEIMTCESAVRENLRPKLLSFHENRRPPYWGTWRKKSAFVKPRRPFGQDEKQLDYEVDSDEEWEEEPDGESINGSAAGSDDEEADEYEVDNEVFVPHGYLSDEEATMDEEDDVLSLSPEAQKARLKYLEDEFETEMKKPTEKLKPRIYGLLWETSDGGKPDNCVDALWNYFQKWSMIMGDPTSLLKPSAEPEEVDKKKVKKRKSEAAENSPKAESKKKTKSESKEVKSKADVKKNTSDSKKNQRDINSFLSKVKS